LRVAALNGHLEIVRILLLAGSDPKANDMEALRWAGISGHNEIYRLLFDAVARQRGAEPAENLKTPSPS